MMKFEILSQSIKKKIENVYVISGKDRFLCYNALNIIKKQLNFCYPDMNYAEYDEERFSEHSIVEACLALPFGDQFRLVVVKDIQNIKKVGQELLDYCQNPVSSTILVFFCPEKCEFSKQVDGLGEKIECDGVSDLLLNQWILKNLQKKGCSIDGNALDLFLEYTSKSMTRISSELEKLASFVGDNKVINKSMIENLVAKDSEYQIFEFTEALTNKNADICLEMFEFLINNSKNGYSIITPVYNYFRRLLFIKISQQTNAELAKDFGIKEFAVKKMREKVGGYTAKTLKAIVDLIAETDLNIKSGKMLAETAVKKMVLQIIQKRNK